MFRRLHPEQPDSFAFTPANEAWAEAQIAKYPEGRRASAVIPLLWRAQEQEGWLTRPAIETVADMLGLARIRALEVATFYFMFQLAPVGSHAHVQVCGTTSCMICGAEDLIAVCKDKIAPKAHQRSADGKLSWEEVECLGACANAPMVQIGKDYYEDLDGDSFAGLLDALARGETPRPGSYKCRFASEPVSGLTSLFLPEGERQAANASVALAEAHGDTLIRITGEHGPDARKAPPGPAAPDPAAVVRDGEAEPREPEGLDREGAGGSDDLKRIKGIGPKLEAKLNEIGVRRLEQIAGWGAAELAWLDENLGEFRGRATRDDWVTQARALAEEAADA
jgi:NADH-quinone oxidoreductase subunit E